VVRSSSQPTRKGIDMEAKDTIMKTKEISEAKKKVNFYVCLWNSDGVTAAEFCIAKDQAEISFKSGEDQGYKNGSIAGYNKGKQEAIESHFEGLKEGHKVGIKEVVNWMGCNSLLEFPHGLKVRSISEALWQAFLKEKGIE